MDCGSRGQLFRRLLSLGSPIDAVMVVPGVECVSTATGNCSSVIVEATLVVIERPIVEELVPRSSRVVVVGWVVVVVGWIVVVVWVARGIAIHEN